MLRLARGSHFGAAGHIFTAYVFTNASRIRCVLYGYPGLQFARSNGQAIRTTEQRGGAYTFPAVRPRTVVLAPGGQASFSSEVFDDPQTGKGEITCPTAVTVRVIPPNGYRQLSAPFGPSAVCDFGITSVSPVVPGGQGVTFQNVSG